jgi:Family of unknown function (DUF6281)
VVTAALVLTGILATIALGDSCEEAVEWNGERYVSVTTTHGGPGRGARLGEGEIPDCSAGGRCAPPGEAVTIFRVAGIDPGVAVAAPDGVFLAPGTFPALPDHPLHEAVFGSPASPSYREPCGTPFRFSGEVTQASVTLRVDPSEPAPEQLSQDDGQVWVEFDADTVVAGFDRDGIATIDVGTPVDITARLCEGELAGPLADRVEPAAPS